MAAADKLPPPSIQLYVRFSAEDEAWLHALTIPIDILPRLTRRPLKFLRYVAYTILGCDGSLTNVDGTPVPNPNMTLPEDLSSLAGSLYFIPEGEWP